MDHTVLPATRQRWHSSGYRSQINLVPDFAIRKGRKAVHHRICRSTASRSPVLTRGGICVLPTVTYLPYRVSGSTLTAWNSLPDFIRDPTSSTDYLGIYLKRTCSRVTNASSTSALLNEYALRCLYTHSLTEGWVDYICIGCGTPGMVVVHNGVHTGGHEADDLHVVYIPAGLGPAWLGHPATHLALYPSRRRRQTRRQLRHYNALQGSFNWICSESEPARRCVNCRTCPVCVCVCHKSVLRQIGWKDRAGFWHWYFRKFIPDCDLRKSCCLQK